MTIRSDGDGGAEGVRQWGPEVRPKLRKVPKEASNGEVRRRNRDGSDEVPHTVTLDDRPLMAESEVTQRQYRKPDGNESVEFQGDDLPVENVSWFDAVGYCNALSVKEKLAPCYQINGTTVGWAEGVKCTGIPVADGSGSGNTQRIQRADRERCRIGHSGRSGVAGNAGSTTHAVKTKTANGRGLYDLSGNVFEWVWDWYQSNYEALQSSDPIGPKVQPSPEYRVIRGGAWGLTAIRARCGAQLQHAHVSQLQPRLSHCEV